MTCYIASAAGPYNGIAVALAHDRKRDFAGLLEFCFGCMYDDDRYYLWRLPFVRLGTEEHTQHYCYRARHRNVPFIVWCLRFTTTSAYEMFLRSERYDDADAILSGL